MANVDIIHQKRGQIAPYKLIIYEKKGPIAYITLNRPEKLNALNQEILIEWEDACGEAKDDNEVRVVVIKGAGRAFSSGYDIGNPGEGSLIVSPEMTEERYDGMHNHVNAYFRAIWDNPKVFIAQIHGFCLAGGGDMACFCDLKVASDDAAFGYPIVREGTMATSFIWPYVLPMAKARELTYTGTFMNAKDAYMHGMVNKVVPREKLDEEVYILADAISKVPYLSVKFHKLIINRMYEMIGIRQGISWSADLKLKAVSASIGVEFRKLVKEKGLKASLEQRDAKFAAIDKAAKELRARKYD